MYDYSGLSQYACSNVFDAGHDLNLRDTGDLILQMNDKLQSMVPSHSFKVHANPNAAPILAINEWFGTVFLGNAIFLFLKGLFCGRNLTEFA